MEITLREIHKVSSYKKLHGEFIKIGLLCDLDLDTKEDVDFVRLSLARAITYCTDKEKGRQVSMESGPIGQLSAVVFKKNNALECILSEDMHEEEKETETGENTVQSMSSEDISLMKVIADIHRVF